MTEATKPETGKRNGALTYAYTDIARAPSWHFAADRLPGGTLASCRVDEPRKGMCYARGDTGKELPATP